MPSFPVGQSARFWHQGRILAVVLGLACGTSACGRIGFESTPLATDAAQNDMDALAPKADADNGQQGCVPLAPGTLALYSFEDPQNVGADSSGNHPATSAIVPDTVVGPPGCGAALSFKPGTSSFLTVPDSVDWQLDVGSIDFWFKANGNEVQGLLSRDALGRLENGHLAVVFYNGAVYLRQQTMVDDLLVCSASQLSLGEWHRVQINFGAPGVELRVNGVLASRSDTVTVPGLIGNHACMTSFAAGLRGNSNAWLIGASNHASVDGDPTPLASLLFLDGAIDEVRISMVRRSAE